MSIVETLRGIRQSIQTSQATSEEESRIMKYSILLISVFRLLLITMVFYQLKCITEIADSRSLTKLFVIGIVSISLTDMTIRQNVLRFCAVPCPVERETYFFPIPKVLWLPQTSILSVYDTHASGPSLSTFDIQVTSTVTPVIHSELL